MPCDFWLDVVKTLIGTFIGAGLAFGFAWLLRLLQVRSDRRAAFGAAAQILAMQANDFHNFQRSLVEVFEARTEAEKKTIPRWFILQPIAMAFNETLHFDWKAVGFLFNSTQGQEVVAKLAHCEVLHFGLADVVKRHQDVALEMQRVIATKYPAPERQPTWAEVESGVGPALWHQMKSMGNALGSNLQSEPAFREALAAVRDFARVSLGMALAASWPASTHRELR